jgi:hypothetical protein
MDKLANGIRLNIEITPVVNYALQQNRVPILQELDICNETAEPLNNVTLKIWSEPEIVTVFLQSVDAVPAGAARESAVPDSAPRPARSLEHGA